MSKRLSLLAKAIAITAVTIAALVALPVPQASAATVARQNVWVYGQCDGILYSNSHSPVQVRATIYRSKIWNTSVATCMAWLERRYNGGSWKQVGMQHYAPFPGMSDSTAWYDDSGTGQARVCVLAIIKDVPNELSCTLPW